MRTSLPGRCAARSGSWRGSPSCSACASRPAAARTTDRPGWRRSPSPSRWPASCSRGRCTSGARSTRGGARGGSPWWALDALARRRYGLDALYGGVYRGVVLAFSRLIGWIDRYLVDGMLNVVSAWTLRGGDMLRGIQSGVPQDYVYGVAFGVLLLFVWARLWMR